MLVLSRKPYWIAWPLLLFAAAGCSKRNLDLGDGRIGLDGGGGSVGVTDAAPSDVTTGIMPPLPDAGPGIGADGSGGGCGVTRVLLPWTTSTTAPLHLSVAASTDAVAVMNRQANTNTLDVRTYALDGSPVGGYQWQGDAQFLTYEDDRFLLVTRATTQDFMITSLGSNLMGGTRLDLASANVTEHILGVVGAPPSSHLLTDQRFVNFADGTSVTWSAMLGPTDANPFKSGRIFGLAALSDRVLVAWSQGGALRLAAVDLNGNLLAHVTDASFFDASLPDTATAIPYDTGLLMFDGNPVRLTQIGPDLSRRVIGRSTMLGVFNRTAPQVGALVWRGEPTAFWLSVYPDTDTSQGAAIHQVYGCTFNLADLSTCAGLWIIDSMAGQAGYGVAQDPVAATALPRGGAAVAFTDSGGASWLYVDDMSCPANGAEP
jgi:hypothetical protein